VEINTTLTRVADVCGGMMIVTLEEDDEGNLVLPLSDKLLEEVGWNTGDAITWVDNKDGSFTLRKKTMPKFTFICDHGERDAKITYEFEHDFLDDIVGEFESFLKGSGFAFNGQQLEFVDETVFSTPEEKPKQEKSYDFNELDKAIKSWDVGTMAQWQEDDMQTTTTDPDHSVYYYDTERNK